MSKRTREDLNRLGAMYARLNDDAFRYGVELMIVGSGTAEWNRIKPLYEAAKVESQRVGEEFAAACKEYRKTVVEDEWLREDGKIKKVVN